VAPRAIWKGAISFGMVVIPIRLYPATQSKDISFVQLHSTCHNRIRQKKHCPFHETIVDQDEIVRGYEYTKDQYVVMEPSDFEDLPVPSIHTIEIARFIQLSDIDPVFFEKAYVLEPEPVGQKPFYLLKRALESTSRVAIAKVSIRQKEHLCCLRPYEGALAMATMFYSDEIRSMAELDLPDEEAAVSDQEMAMATTLIDQLTGPFEPEQYQDEYRVALEHVIEAKLGSGAPVTAAPAPPPGKVVDLMEALRASIQATKQDSKSKPSEPAAEEQSKPKARSRKKAAQKVG
jgi:DNA end-binding protein Ku